MQETKNSNLFDKNCTTEVVKYHIQHEEKWLRSTAIEQVNYYFPLIFPQRNSARKLSFEASSEKSNRVFSEKSQNAWKTICERVFFVSLQVDFSQLTSL